MKKSIILSFIWGVTCHGAEVPELSDKEPGLKRGKIVQDKHETEVLERASCLVNFLKEETPDPEIIAYLNKIGRTIHYPELINHLRLESEGEASFQEAYNQLIDYMREEKKIE